MAEKPRKVNVKLGQMVKIHAGPNVELELYRLESGAVHLRNVKTDGYIRSWSPKESGTRRRRKRADDGCKPLEELLRF